VHGAADDFLPLIRSAQRCANKLPVAIELKDVQRVRELRLELLDAAFRLNQKLAERFEEGLLERFG